MILEASSYRGSTVLMKSSTLCTYTQGQVVRHRYETGRIHHIHLCMHTAQYMNVCMTTNLWDMTDTKWGWGHSVESETCHHFSFGSKKELLQHYFPFQNTDYSENFDSCTYFSVSSWFQFKRHWEIVCLVLLWALIGVRPLISTALIVSHLRMTPHPPSRETFSQFHQFLAYQKAEVPASTLPCWLLSINCCIKIGSRNINFLSWVLCLTVSMTDLRCPFSPPRLCMEPFHPAEITICCVELVWGTARSTCFSSLEYQWT